jgi:hypothetical protein
MNITQEQYGNKKTENLIIMRVGRGEASVTAESGDADSNVCKLMESKIF